MGAGAGWRHTIPIDDVADGSILGRSVDEQIARWRSQIGDAGPKRNEAVAWQRQRVAAVELDDHTVEPDDAVEIWPGAGQTQAAVEDEPVRKRVGGTGRIVTRVGVK